MCAGCATGAFDGAGAGGEHLFCPALVTYPPEFSARLAAEAERLPLDSAALRALLDYAALRDQVRACARVSSGHR